MNQNFLSSIHKDNSFLLVNGKIYDFILKSNDDMFVNISGIKRGLNYSSKVEIYQNHIIKELLDSEICKYSQKLNLEERLPLTSDSNDHLLRQILCQYIDLINESVYQNDDIKSAKDDVKKFKDDFNFDFIFHEINKSNSINFFNAKHFLFFCGNAYELKTSDFGEVKLKSNYFKLGHETRIVTLEKSLNEFYKKKVKALVKKKFAFISSQMDDLFKKSLEYPESRESDNKQVGYFKLNDNKYVIYNKFDNLILKKVYSKKRSNGSLKKINYLDKKELGPMTFGFKLQISNKYLEKIDLPILISKNNQNHAYVHKSFTDENDYNKICKNKLKFQRSSKFDIDNCIKSIDHFRSELIDIMQHYHVKTNGRTHFITTMSWDNL